jgi:hypothetical protein
MYVGPRSPWRSTGRKPVLWRNLRKYFRVWRTHVGEILLVERVVAMMPSFLPRMASLCHNGLRSQNAATPQLCEINALVFGGTSVMELHCEIDRRPACRVTD